MFSKFQRTSEGHFLLVESVVYFILAKIEIQIDQKIRGIELLYIESWTSQYRLVDLLSAH